MGFVVNYPPATSVTVDESTNEVVVAAAGPRGPQGDPGVVAATAPLTYDSGTQTVALDESGIEIAPSQVTGTAVVDNDSRLLPAGGSASQVLTKSTSTNYDAAWQTPVMPIYAHGRVLANGTPVYVSGMSVSRSGAGVYVYTFSSARADTNYSVVATPAAAPGTDPNIFVHTFTNSGFTLTIGVGDNSSAADVPTDFDHSILVVA